MRSKWINKTRNPFTFELPGTKQKVETLRSRFGHFTENDKLRFAINGFTLPDNNFEQTQVALGWPNRHKFYSAPQNPLLDLSKRTLDSLKSVFNIPDWRKQSLQQTHNNGNDDINVADYLHNSCTVNDKASIWYWSRLLGIFRKD